MIPTRLMWFVVLASFAACTPSTTESPPQLLRVDDEDLQLGEVYESRLDRVLPIYNDSGSSVVVSDLSGNCNCTSIHPKSFRIEPGGRQDVTLRLNLTGKSGPFSVNLVARSADEHRPHVWVLEGRVIELFDDGGRSPLVAVPYPEQSISVPLRLKVPVRHPEVKSEYPIEQVKGTFTDESVRLDLTLSDQAPFGTLSTAVLLTGKTDQNQNIQLHIPVTLQRERPFSLRPTLMNFGRVAAGGSISSTLRITFSAPCTGISIRSAPMTVEALVPPFEGELATKEIDLTISVKKATAGVFSGNIVVTATVDAKEFTFSIPVTYYGE